MGPFKFYLNSIVKYSPDTFVRFFFNAITSLLHQWFIELGTSSSSLKRLETGDYPTDGRATLVYLCFVPVIAANTRPFSVITRTPPSPRRSPLRILKRPRPSFAGRRNDSFARGPSSRDLDLISDRHPRDRRIDKSRGSDLRGRQESFENVTAYGV